MKFREIVPKNKRVLIFSKKIFFARKSRAIPFASVVGFRSYSIVGSYVYSMFMSIWWRRHWSMHAQVHASMFSVSSVLTSVSLPQCYLPPVSLPFSIENASTILIQCPYHSSQCLYHIPLCLYDIPQYLPFASVSLPFSHSVLPFSPVYSHPPSSLSH